MKLVIIILMTLGLAQTVQAKPKTKAKKAAPVTTEPTTEKEEKVEKFSELRLRGNLKRPELAYDFEDESKNSEIPLTTPEEFNDELLRDTDNR